MKVLFIGGTGTISSAISHLAIQKGMDVYLLNRGNRTDFIPENAKVITADINNEEEVLKKLDGESFDVVVDFIAFNTLHIERDYRLFKDRTSQYIFISSASAYQKPLASPYITESTLLDNPYWEYSRNKIACEALLMEKYQKEGFPITIIRPSHTYGKTAIPVALRGKNGSFSVVERIRKGKKVIVPGDGNSLWTLTYNEDFAKAFIGIMGNVYAIGEAYHITSDESLTWNQIYEIIASALGVKVNIVHIPTDVLILLGEDFTGSLLGDKAHSVIFDNSKIKKAVPDFSATTRFEEGVRYALDYIYSHTAWQKEDPAFDTWCDKVITSYEACINQLPKLD